MTDTQPQSQETVSPSILDEPILTLPPNITIRTLRPSDADSTAHHCNNRNIWLRMTNSWSYPYTLKHATAWIAGSRDPTSFVASGPFDVERCDGTGQRLPTKYGICVNDVVVGGIGLIFRDDVRCRTANLGYWLGEEFWYGGVMSRVAPAFVEWCWGTWGRLLRLDGGVYAGNPASCKVLERCGFTYVHRARKSIFKDGKVLDCDVYEAVREDGDEAKPEAVQV